MREEGPTPALRDHADVGVAALALEDLHVGLLARPLGVLDAGPAHDLLHGGRDHRSPEIDTYLP